MYWLKLSGPVLLAILTLALSALAEFNFTQLPSQILIGQIYDLVWTGAIGAVEIYIKKDASASSWRAHVYGGGYDTHYLWTATDLLEPGRTYILSAYDYGTETIYNSKAIPVLAARKRVRDLRMIAKPDVLE